MLAQRHTRELLQLNPQLATEAIASIEESGQLENFRANCHRLAVRRSGVDEVATSMQLVHQLTDMIRNTLTLVSGNSLIISCYCRLYMQSVRCCQRFIRKSLSQRRRDKAAAKAKWVAVQDRARVALKNAIRNRQRRFKSCSTNGDELWSLLIDCYVSLEDMSAAIDLYYREISWTYRRRLQAYQATSSCDAATTSLNPVRLRRLIAKRMLQYPLMSAVVNLNPQVAQLCLALAYSQTFNGRLGESGRLSRRDMGSTVARPDFTKLPTETTVSYYHALITLNPTENIPLLMAMRSVMTGLEATSFTRLGGPTRQDFARAEALRSKWQLFVGDSVPAEPPVKVVERTEPKRDANGHPSSRVDCGACATFTGSWHAARPMTPRPPITSPRSSDFPINRQHLKRISQARLPPPSKGKVASRQLSCTFKMQYKTVVSANASLTHEDLPKL